MKDMHVKGLWICVLVLVVTMIFVSASNFTGNQSEDCSSREICEEIIKMECLNETVTTCDEECSIETLEECLEEIIGNKTIMDCTTIEQEVCVEVNCIDEIIESCTDIINQTCTTEILCSSDSESESPNKTSEDIIEEPGQNQALLPELNDAIVFENSLIKTTLSLIINKVKIFVEEIVKLRATLKHENESIDAIEEKLLVEYLKQHCKDIGVLSVLGDPQDAIIRAVDYDPNSLIVMGAYGRSSLSMFFHSSTADKILKSQKAPTFITHK
ncbi:MAG: universal stress protein [Bacteroidetes bacterium]|nr:universal stress protein [Bacteroidota bacterium]